MRVSFILLITIVCVAAGGLALTYQYLKTNNESASAIQSIPSPTAAIAATQGKTITFNGQQFAYSYFTVQNPADISLIPNFSHPKDAESLMADNKCTEAINGGFYDKSNKPLGYFVSGGKVTGGRIESDLVNGFLWADASGSAVISSALPDLTFRFALQTGPMLMFNGKSLALSMNKDTSARRMVAAKTMDNSFVFLTVYNGESVYGGPLLADLPGIIQTISAKESIQVAEAINLDGGSASAFYSDDAKLSELTPVGSLFCNKL